VHIAPAFGEDDHQAHRAIERARPGIPLLCAVEPDGTFIARFERYKGRWVKDADKDISRELKESGLLIHAEQYRHDYPFCWRSDSDPLIQYARPAWYIRTTEKIDRAIEQNQKIHWVPDHIKDGRFGDFLAHNVDWALSRERWWGTPLNVWVCDADPEHKEVPTSVEKIEKKNPHAFDHFHAARRADPSLSEHLIVHKPWIDQVTFPCTRCAGTMRRVPEVIDVWFDSGCMPFAQWGYPHQPGSKEQFARSFPADFISEAIDQTRGWFYSLLMVSTLVFEDAPMPHPYRTCMVLGHVSDKEGRKESKSKGNYTPPEVILDKVAMEFAVLGDEQASVKAVKEKKGVALIGHEDVDGLDLRDGARVRLYRGDAPEQTVDLVLEASKKLRRRVVVLHADDRAALGVLPTSTTDVAPVNVPRLPVEERVFVSDPATPAPGADAFRWFFFAASPPWSATRHSLSNVRALQKEFAVKLRNVYSFFTIYANIDGFVPPVAGAAGETVRAPASELDRWILGELAITVRDVTTCLDAYDVYGATQILVTLVDALSNWWVRLSRGRFWKSGLDDDKRSAHETLYTCLVTLAKLAAPFTPYAAEGMYQNLVVRPSLGPSGGGARAACESVHLEAWPDADIAAIDEALSQKIATVRALVSLGLQVRTQAKLKVRQPLRCAFVITAQLELLDASSNRQIADELNTQAVEFVPLASAAQYVEYVVKPSFRALGQRGLGREAQLLKKTMAALSSADALSVASQVMSGGAVTLEGVELRRNDVEVEFVAKEGFAAAGDRTGVVVLDTRIDDELRDLGFLRELLNRIQTLRKEMGLEYTDRIRVWIAGSDHVRRVLDAPVTGPAGAESSGAASLAAEVLAVAVSAEAPPPGVSADPHESDVEGEGVCIWVARA
jgi:isoleucyl-tRNA synthetase